MNQQNSVLVIGSVAFDTLHLQGKVHEKVLGGSGLYAAVAASTFGPVRLVGVVGNDFPDSATQILKNRQVDLAGLEVADGLTFHWEGRYAGDLSSRDTLRTDLNVFADFHPKVPASFAASEYVLLGNIGPDLQLEVLEQLTKPKLVVADTMNLWIDIQLDNLKKLLTKIDVLVLNEEEARQLTGGHQIVDCANKLLDMGPGSVVIKRGEYGAMLWHAGKTFSAPAYPVQQAVDPTGAGDSFAGGMVGFLARTNRIDDITMRRAVIYGSASASCCVEAVGVTGVLDASREQIDERYEAFRELAHIPTSS